jgi:hypothetical protein
VFRRSAPRWLSTGSVDNAVHKSQWATPAQGIVANGIDDLGVELTQPTRSGRDSGRPFTKQTF